MSVQNVKVLVPPLRTVPPGAAWIAAIVGWVFGSDPRHPSGLKLWRAAAKVRWRAHRAARRDAAARVAVIALARRFESSQPEFAKDLYAAARVDLRD